MASRHQWFRNGQPLDVASASRLSHDEEWQLMCRAGAVRLTAGDLGTEIKWVVASPCVASLSAVEALLDGTDGPYVLRFFAAGWFEETYRNAVDVHIRVAALVMHGDRHIASKVFEKPSLPDGVLTPEIVRQALHDLHPPSELAIECRYDEVQDSFLVCRIGELSTIGRIWGTDPTTYPCLATGPYGSSASAAYKRALATGLPAYEQVIAALRFPDQALRWIPYHRVILPRIAHSGAQTVSVVSACADVDFRVL